MQQISPRLVVVVLLAVLSSSGCIVSTGTKPTERPAREPAAQSAPTVTSAAEPAAPKHPRKKKAPAPPAVAPKTAKAAAQAAPASAPSPAAPSATTEPPPAGARIHAPDVATPSRLVIPIRVPFASAVAKVDALLEKTAKQDWTRASKPGDSPEVEVKYTLWREPLKASFDEHTLRLVVPVHYAATVRAKVKNPLTGKDLWITKGETWGTKAEPQQLTATLHAKLIVADDLAFEADSKLDELQHGKAPSGEVCVKAIAQVCVSKASLASQVRKHIEARLTPRIKKALGEADEKLEDALALKARAQTLWASLQEPRSLQAVLSAACPKKASDSCKTNAWLVIKPTALGLAQPHMDGADLRADVSISGDFAVVIGDKPTVVVTPLPRVQSLTGGDDVRVAATLRLPFEVLGPELTKALKGERFADKTDPGAKALVIKAVTLADQGGDTKPHRVALSAAVSGPLEGALGVLGTLAYDAKTQTLSLSDLAYDAKTQELADKQLTGIDHAALRERLVSKARISLAPALAQASQAVSTAIAQSAPGALQLSGELNQVEFEDFKVGPHAVVVTVKLGGRLAVTYTPK